MKNYYDQHTHSFFSHDSKEDLRNYFLKAKENNIEYVCTCEHYDYLTVLDGIIEIPDYDKLIEYQKQLKSEFPEITPLLGIEVGYKKIAIKEIEKLCNKYDFDIIQLSLHESEKEDYYLKTTFINNEDKGINKYLDLVLEAINTIDNFDCLSHIDYGFKTLKLLNNNQEFSKYDEKIKIILKALIEKGKALEINTKTQEAIYNIDKNDHHIHYLLKTYYELGGRKITLSSDAHSVEKYMLLFDKYMNIIKEHGFLELSYFIKRKEYKYKI